MIANSLADILPGLLPRPTWRPSKGPQLAALDRILVSHQDTLPIEMLVHWSYPHTEFDHAMITACLQHSLARSGFAGASRPDTHAIQECTTAKAVQCRFVCTNQTFLSVNSTNCTPCTEQCLNGSFVSSLCTFAEDTKCTRV